MKIHTTITAALVLSVSTLTPAGVARAGGPAECQFVPNSFTVTINPALFEIEGPINPEDPAVADLFTPGTLSFDATQRFTGGQAQAYFTLTVGGAVYVDSTGQSNPSLGEEGSAIPVTLPSGIPWAAFLPGAGGSFLDNGNADFLADFGDFDGWMSALMNPSSYPIAIEVAYADSAAPLTELCTLSFEFEVGSTGRKWNIDLSHYLERASDASNGLPDTL